MKFLTCIFRGLTKRKAEAVEITPLPATPEIPSAPYPKRWSIPAKTIRSRLGKVLIDDEDDPGEKRQLTFKEIDELTAHWKDMVHFAKISFKNAFTLNIMKYRPYLQFLYIDDYDTCEICKRLANKIIRSDDPRAAKFYPPLHIGCRVIAVTVSEEEIKRDGLIIDWPELEPPDVFTVSLLP